MDKRRIIFDIAMNGSMLLCYEHVVEVVNLLVQILTPQAVSISNLIGGVDVLQTILFWPVLYVANTAPQHYTEFYLIRKLSKLYDD